MNLQKLRMRRAFTIIEVMIALLIVSALALGIANYMKRQQKSLSGSETSRSLSQDLTLVGKILTSDLNLLAYINPSCVDSNASASIACSAIKIRGGITPLPGTSSTEVGAMVSFAPPANIDADVATLTNDNDSVRIFQMADTSNFSCKLDPTVAVNPSTTLEKLWVSTACGSLMSVGGVYLIVQETGGVVYSNVFQVTALDDNEMTIGSTGNYYNQTGGLGISGFTNTARIFPLKIVEIAANPTERTVLRREFSPAQDNMVGATEWRQIAANIETLQFHYVTTTSSGSTWHQRTMAFGGEATDNGIEDIRGVSPWIVGRSPQTLESDDWAQDNPLTAAVESDGYRRLDKRIFINFSNYSN